MDEKPDESLLEETVAQAETWLRRADRLMTPTERKMQIRMARLIAHPMDKVVLSKLIDQGFRSKNHARAADQIRYILDRFGIPRFFSPAERFLAKTFMVLGPYLPALLVPAVIQRIMDEASGWILPGERDLLHAHLEQRAMEGVRMNINHLGEAILGEDAALNRLMLYLEDLNDPSVECISVKISTLCSQIQPLAFEYTVALLEDRQSTLYRAAATGSFTRKDGTKVPRFVYLDMEEYRDLELTAAVFRRTLDRDEFLKYPAGIALQAYLPDSMAIQRELTEWARERTAAGGSPIRIRIVKGANMEMERLESSIRNWPLAPFGTKADTDANFIRMVQYGMRPENIKAVSLGIASHNIFDLACAYRLASRNGVSEHLSIEMLEGMADNVRKAVAEDVNDILLYAPVARHEQFVNAISYLFRRLDENTGRGNFLRYAPTLKSGSGEWNELKAQFVTSWRRRNSVDVRSHRRQNRAVEEFQGRIGTFHTDRFSNEPDTDWSVSSNRKWAEGIREKWLTGPEDAPVRVSLVLAGREVYDGRDIRESKDPSRFGEEVCVVRFALANNMDVSHAMSAARDDTDGWRKMDRAARHEVLSRVADELRRSRGDLIGAAAAETGKVFTEADPEVSEAVDFAEFYPWSVGTFDELKGVSCRGKGVGVVISPWNFPIAIPAGGILASLAAGNTVIFKPASTAVLVGWQVCQCFWRAGVSRKVLQFLPCDGADVGRKLTNHPDADFVIFTGGTDTGMSILKSKPDLCLMAETGGKNATIVTAMADRDQAVGNVVFSAFSNTGQKCSATSLLVLEREVCEDVTFKRQLVDAARSFRTGSAWNLENQMGPLIRPPGRDLMRALTDLADGETWALEPRNIGDNPHLWTPGIKWGVSPGSYSHMTEFFGPVLSVLCAEDLDHAIEIVNMTGYGLTSAIESLDPREHEKWRSQVLAGNLYVNKGTTGAVVLRQPFGGMGKSVIGAGTKVGGPNYVAQFMETEQTSVAVTGPPDTGNGLRIFEPGWEDRIKGRAEDGPEDEPCDELDRTVEAIRSYLYKAEVEFNRERDYFSLRGQDNILRYLPAGNVVVRVHIDDSLFDVLARVAAGRIACCRISISLPPELAVTIPDFLKSSQGMEITGGSKVLRQSDADLIETVPNFDRIRYAAPDRVPLEVYSAAAKHGVHVARDRVMMEGRLELLHYLKEQSVSVNYHRYGNLGERGEEINIDDFLRSHQG